MAGRGIVGSWRVGVRIPGAGQDVVNLASFSSDQTVVVAFATPSPAAPGQNHHAEFFSTALGAWDTLSDGSIAMTFVSLGADENGNPAGLHTISAQVQMASDGQSWSGPFQIEVTSAADEVVATVAGTTQATRIVARGLTTAS